MSERDISEIAERLRARLDGWPDEARMAIMCADLRAILDDRDQLLEADALSIETIMTMNRRITQLEAELAEAREALEPFADAAEPIEHDTYGRWNPEEWDARVKTLTVGQFRRARAFLNKDKPHD